MGKKMKITAGELTRYLHEIDADACQTFAYKVVDVNKEEIRGTTYRLSRALTMREKLYLDSFANTIMQQFRPSYAAEIVCDCVWVGDKCLISKKAKMTRR